ncbi:MAG: complex I subunit 5 family protein [Acholeplasmataceae bacterium]
MTLNKEKDQQKKRIYGPHFSDKFTGQSTILVLVMVFFLMMFVGLIKNWFNMLGVITEQPAVVEAFMAVTSFKFLPLILISIPLVGAYFQATLKHMSAYKRDWIVILMTFMTIVIVMLIYPVALKDGIELIIPHAFGLGISFRIDMLGFSMLLVTSVLWFLVMVYAHEYMKKEKHTNRFFLFMAITYSSVLGAIVSGDLLTMFLFFELMTIASYMLVTHTQKPESFVAGYNYIFMGIVGGFSILSALLLIYFNVGDLSFKSAISALSTLGATRYWIMGLLILGFGIKAGMAPVHVWLPRAHPVAPTPASALLSGIMIKVGAFGILRVATSYYFPLKGEGLSFTNPIWLTSQTIGAAVIWLGIATMAVGVFFALQQSNMKKMLAYHSISQMGYIMMGIGVALYLGYKGAMGYSGALYHIINHALFKSLLFMVAGVVYFHTQEQDMYKLGGLWRKLPLTATVCFIASMGISGIPLFNGFISKSILHHGIVEAYTYGHSSFFYAEILFLIVSAGTVCSFIKLFYYVFLRKLPDQYQSIKAEYTSLDTAMVAIALIIIFIGLNPRFILNEFILPQLNILSYDPDFINKYIIGLAFFTLKDQLTMLGIFIAGMLIFVLGKKYHWFHLHLPGWLNIEYIVFYPMNFVMRRACKLMYGNECPLDEGPLAKMALKKNNDVGFLERFTFMTNVFNRRYETNIIKSDAFIYTLFVTLILVFMFIFNTF